MRHEKIKKIQHAQTLAWLVIGDFVVKKKSSHAVLTNLSGAAARATTTFSATILRLLVKVYDLVTNNLNYTAGYSDTTQA